MTLRSSTMSMHDFANLRGHTLCDQSGDNIGEITDLYLDEDTGRPKWIAVNTGYGNAQSFVPISEIDRQGTTLSVPFSREKIESAPRVDADGRLSPEEEEEEELYRHGVDMDDVVTTSPAAGTPGSSDRDSAMTRSEEEVSVGKQREESGRVRLRKWVETEHMTETVPVQREEARIVREPVTEHNIDQATTGADLREDAQEITLNEERVTVQKEAVPKERVRLEKNVVTEHQPVEADIRKEHIEVEEDAGTKRNR